MRYILLIYQDERARATMSEAERASIFKQYGAFTESIRASGAFQAGEPLQPTRTATTVRAKNGKTLTLDGPFAETKEQLGGFYIVDAKNLDDALAMAARIPAVQLGGAVEVRPIMEMTAPH